jgi:FAD/FMN-containing dehydrogenase
MDDAHNVRVKRITDQVKNLYANEVPFRIYRGATNATRVVSFEKDKIVDVGDLDHILEINPGTHMAIVEPNVPMDKLVTETLRYGLMPPVVMEFPGITVGGGLQGGAGESSSYKWGTFDKTIAWFDMLQADGTMVRASKTAHKDLFRGVPGSYGSLGVVTAIAVQLVPAKPFVALSYVPVHSFADAVARLAEAKKRKPDFIDGIMFNKKSGVILVGTLQDIPNQPIVTLSKATDEWFYLRAQQQAEKTEPCTDYIPLKDYLFRYDRGAFWTAAFVFKRAKVPFTRFSRWLLDPLLHTRKMYAALQASGMSQECIIQDVAMPEDRTVAFMEYVDIALGIYPVWLCPLKVDKISPLLFNHSDADAIINIGVWGLPKKNARVANRELEDKILKLGGKKWLYAESFYDEKTFWKIYDTEGTHRDLRQKYRAESLPTVYDKVHVTKQYPISTRKGVLFALFGRNGLRKK